MGCNKPSERTCHRRALLAVYLKNYIIQRDVTILRYFYFTLKARLTGETTKTMSIAILFSAPVSSHHPRQDLSICSLQ